MNDYETRREEKIKANQALLAELNIQAVASRTTKPKVDTDARPAKRRKVFAETAPSRTSARIASAPVRPAYNDGVETKDVRLPRSAPKKAKVTGNQSVGSRIVRDAEPLVPTKDVESVKARWSAWEVTGKPPIRDQSTKTFHFEDFPEFTPNKSPAEMLREGCFGGSYYRPLKSRKLGIIVQDDWEELPKEWLDDLDIERYLTSPTYDPEVNKYKVSCGQSIEEWEAAGWISHEHDVRGWFQWYTRFFRGRRCDDDGRQLGVREVFDDGMDEDAPEVSPVMHQTCHHWAFEVRQEHLDAFWTSRGR